MRKKVIIMRKAQRAMNGENIILGKQIESTFEKTQGNVGVVYAHYYEDFAETFGQEICQDIWDSLPELDGEASNDYVRVTLSVEKVSPEEVNHII